jgi:hypothetical protein
MERFTFIDDYYFMFEPLSDLTGPLQKHELLNMRFIFGERYHNMRVRQAHCSECTRLEELCDSCDPQPREKSGEAVEPLPLLHMHAAADENATEPP